MPSLWTHDKQEEMEHLAYPRKAWWSNEWNAVDKVFTVL
jgi:hypothetical protein